MPREHIGDRTDGIDPALHLTTHREAGFHIPAEVGAHHRLDIEAGRFVCCVKRSGLLRRQHTHRWAVMTVHHDGAGLAAINDRLLPVVVDR